MKHLLYFTLIIALISCKRTTNTNELLSEGVTKQLAEYRIKQVSDVVYHLSFEIPEKKSDSIRASLVLDVLINNLDHPLILDFKPDNNYPILAKTDDKLIDTKHFNEHIVIPSRFLVLGKNQLKLEFTAGEQSLNRNENHLFTLLVPDRARTLFPCFDQPDIKARYKLEITAPTMWKVLCSSKLKEKLDTAGFATHYFELSDPMSTYLFSFVAGEFASVKNDQSKLQMQLLHQETDPEKIRLSTNPIFNIHNLSIDYLEEYTQFKFPFQKLDIASIYTHPYGGMEHVGTIQYRQNALFLDSSATQTQLLRRAKVIAHETSHMWFGDLVTMKWFDDVWLKEVFANFMADKIINPQFPSIDHNLLFLTAHYPRAYSIDRTRGTHPIRQKLDNLNKAGSLYGHIIYNKAPIMMRQLETLIGKEMLQEGMIEYLHKYAYGNAEWKDLIEILDRKTELNLQKWSEVWVNSPGRPVFSSHIEYNTKNEIESFTVEQKPENGSNMIWPQTFDVMFIYPDSSHIITVNSTKAITSVSEAKELAKPTSIVYNSNAYGYGVFPVDKNSLDLIKGLDNETTRAYSYINCFENCFNGTLPIEDTYSTLFEGIKQEQNELILKLITVYLDKLFWKYLTIEQREEKQPLLETALFARLQKKDASNIKKTLFDLYSDISYKGIGLERLYRIWKKSIAVNNLLLNKDDYTKIAMRLALYNHPESGNILTESHDKLEDTNKRERFEFVLPALSSSAQKRAEYFESFKKIENREKESWVTTACYYMHHPLRQDTTISNLELSLSLLEEIQKTGDIFFPKSWLDNTIGMYTSKEAYEMTTRFIEMNPQLDPKLLAKLLQSTDDMYRVQRIVR